MSFLKDVVIPEPSAQTDVPQKITEKPFSTTKLPGTFLNSVILPTDQARADTQAQYQRDAAAAKQKADQANSFTGLAKATAFDFGKRLIDIPVDFAKNLWATYQNTPTKLAEDINSGAADLAKSNTEGGIPAVTDALKGFGKAGGRTAGDAAIAIFAPISAAIGSVLNATGGQKLIDKTGQVIADASGITDLKAFQQFAVDHPNAGEDFNRILTLFLAKGEKGQIDPAQMFKDSQAFAQKIVGSAEKPAVIEPVAPKTVEAPIPKPDVGTANGKIVPPEYQNTSPQGDFLNNVEKPQAGAVVKQPVSDVAIADSVRKWLNEEKPIPSDILRQLETQKVGVSEVSANKNGEVTVYRDKAPTPGKIESYSLTPKAGQEPYTINKSQIVANLSSDAMKQLFDKAYPGTDIQSIANKDMLAKYGNLENEVFVRNEKPAALKPIGQGETLTSRLAANVQESAIQKKLTTGFGSLPEYQRVDMADQAKYAADLLASDPGKALDVALGKDVPPNHILPEAIFTAVEDAATKAGDIETLRRLATESTLSTEATAMGQRIRALAERSQDSPVKLIQDVKDARQARFEKTAKGKKISNAKADEINSMKNEIKKATPAKQTWGQFIESIKCGY